MKLENNQPINSKAKYLCLLGGYANPDQGCPPWGTICYEEENFLGDRIGEIILSYKNGIKDRIPLVFGYTLWFKEFFFDDMEPFNSNKLMKERLTNSLYLYKALEKYNHGLLKIKLRDLELQSIETIYSKEKTNRASFDEFFLVNNENIIEFENEKYDLNDEFFKTNTIVEFDNIPNHVLRNIEEINHETLTYFSDFDNNYKSDKTPYLKFTGDNYAEMLTEIFDANIKNFLDKIDDEGFLHTSNKDAYLWYYHGFGPYRKFGAFYDKLYSRDAGRSIMSLLLLNEVDKADKVLRIYNKWLMYFPEHKEVTFNKENVIGHFTVMPNEPLIYSTFLVPKAGWKTQFTEEKFGKDYYGLGNLETDGHGLMMMATYSLYKCLNFSKSWALENFKYIKEAANFLVWQLNNPNLTFTKDDLLYGETEGAMNDYTLYANIPCLIALKLYSRIANDINETSLSKTWLETAKRIEKAIERNLISKDNKWLNYGFFHDPVITMFFDVSGTNPEDFLPKEWFEISRNSYEDDKFAYIKDSYFGPRGLGYDQNMITQNSMILNKSESIEFLKALIKLSYAPRLPEPFVVPEGATVDFINKRIRRQGDIGNLVQQTETIKTIYMFAGIGFNDGTSYTIAPKVFSNWTIDYNSVVLPGLFNNDKSTIFNGKYSVAKDKCVLSYEILNKNDSINIDFTFGPFDKTAKTVSINDKSYETFENGDASWITIPLDGSGEITVKINL